MDDKEKGWCEMEWIERMNRAVNYMEEHILKEPDLEMLGKIAGCSSHHFQRIFTYISGMTLTEYIRKRRMSLAAADLKHGNAKVIDVAGKYCYDSPTSFNRAFQSVHGISPSEAKADSITLKAYPPIVFKMSVRGTYEMNYRIEKREEIRVVGKKIPLKSTLEENYQITPGFWKESAMDGTIEKLASMMDGDIQGLMGVSVCNGKDQWEYYIAVATSRDSGEYENLTIPGGTWVIFQDEGPVTKIQELETRIVTEWLPTSGYEYRNAPEIELYLNPDPEKTGFEIWLPITRKGEHSNG